MNDGFDDVESVRQRLFREPFAFDFFQAVRLLTLANLQYKPVGSGGPPSQEVVRFAAVPSLAFPPSSISSLVPGTEASPPKMAVAFMGLTGPSGILPMMYTQIIIEQQRSSDNSERRALQEWLDLFNHRFISLFYRAWVKYRWSIGYELAQYRQTTDQVTGVMLALLGLGTRGLSHRLRLRPIPKSAVAPEPPSGSRTGAEPESIPDLAMIQYAGLFTHAPRSAAGLRLFLSDFFQTDVVVQQFLGGWVSLDLDNQTQIGRGGRNQVLGISAIIGHRYWDIYSRIRLRIRFKDYASFDRFLPDRESGKTRIFLLVELTRFYLRTSLDFDVQLVLPRSEIPQLHLDRKALGLQLGWNTWLGRRPASGDADDPVFRRSTILLRAQ